MKKLILSLMLVSVATVYAQENIEIPKTVLVTSSITKDYQPDYFDISVTIKEYENVNPDDQKVTRFNINEVEQSLNKKLEELSIKSSALNIDNISEATPQQNMYMNGNYTATQKREISKTFTFQLKTIKEVEKAFSILRINGVINVYAEAKITSETQLKIENELLQLAMEKAKSKANKMETLIGKKLGAVNSVVEETIMNNEQAVMNYNNYYYSNNVYMNNGYCAKTLTLKVNFSIE